MSETMTLEIPEALAERARAVATRTQQRVEDVLVAWLSWTVTELPIEALPDEQILALRDLTMAPALQDELSTLLERQRERTITAEERVRLEELMTLYEEGSLQKARALKVAVERQLQPALPGSLTALSRAGQRARLAR